MWDNNGSGNNLDFTKINFPAKAVIYSEEKVLNEIYYGVKKAVNNTHKPVKLIFPCEIKVRYTRTEWAEKQFENICANGINVAYKDDCNTLCA